VRLEAVFKKLTGDAFYRWVKENKINTKELAMHFGIGKSWLYEKWFAKEELPRYMAMAIRFYAREWQQERERLQKERAAG